MVLGILHICPVVNLRMLLIQNFNGTVNIVKTIEAILTAALKASLPILPTDTILRNKV
jgi:hypothetical protein